MASYCYRIAISRFCNCFRLFLETDSPVGDDKEGPGKPGRGGKLLKTFFVEEGIFV